LYSALLKLLFSLRLIIESSLLWPRYWYWYWYCEGEDTMSWSLPSWCLPRRRIRIKFSVGATDDAPGPEEAGGNVQVLGRRHLQVLI